MKRRDFIVGGLSGVALAGCATRAASSLPVATISTDPLVRSEMDRVTRTVVGLRPFRPQGFRLEAEVIEGRTVVHNYGHGGCGVTLSWGCAGRAANMAGAAGERRVAVLGSGVNGITSAYLLARRGFDVTIYAERFPPETTSNVAGALWLPSSLYDDNAVTLEWLAFNRQVTREAHAGFLPYVNRPGYGVYWVHHSDLSNRQVPNPNEVPGGDDLYPDMERWAAPDARFGFPSERRFHSLMIDPDYYLEALLRDALLAGARTEARSFASRDDVLALEEKVVVNCLGLGAGAVFGDADLIPIRGQLSHLLPQPEISYSYVGRENGQTLYMFPRRTGLVLGGTHDRGDNNLAVDPQQVVTMVEGHAGLMRRMAGA